MNIVDKIEQIETSKLIPYARNAREHSDEQIAHIASSIREFGFLSAIVIDKDNVIRAGHGRFLAAQKLGLEKVPCIRADHLTPAQLKAFAIVDNRLSDLSKFNIDLLKLEIEDLKLDDFDLALLPFDGSVLSSSLDNDIDENDNPTKEKTYLLEIECADEQAQKDTYEDLCSQGLIVRFK